jgi:hypothetical protein
MQDVDLAGGKCRGVDIETGALIICCSDTALLQEGQGADRSPGTAWIRTDRNSRVMRVACVILSTLSLVFSRSITRC